MVRLETENLEQDRRPKTLSRPVNFAFSPCPNDTFAFHAIVHGLVPDVRVTPHLDDIEALNIRAADTDAEVTKVSINAYGHGLRDRYVLLRAGGAAGFGVGPIVVARSKRDVGGRIAIPGERTTAALLLRQLGRFDTVVMRFDQIEGAVLRGDADCGVLIHEGRFTYQSKGLTLLTDLGEVWEQRMHCPLPLAAIAIRRDLAPALAPAIDRALRASVEYAFAHPDASRDYVAANAQEMDPDVTRRHIELYVNQYTLDLDESAVHRMLAWGEQQGVFPPSSQPIFAS
jgi:1,4-dihydroxy-6-naphthoate synthase